MRKGERNGKRDQGKTVTLHEVFSHCNRCKYNILPNTLSCIEVLLVDIILPA